MHQLDDHQVSGQCLMSFVLGVLRCFCSNEPIVMINVPQMGESITEGTLVEWCVHPGDTVNQDQIIAQIETGSVLI